MEYEQKKKQTPTLQDVFELYIQDRKDLRESSVFTYRESIKRAGELLNRPIDEIKYSDIKHLFSNLRYEKGYKPATIEMLNNVLNPVFILAVKDDIITKNPMQGAYREVARGSDWRSHHKPALDLESQKEFLDFVSKSPIYRRWENFFIFMFGTGVRIGEAIALKWEDVSFKEKTIEIRRSMYYRNGKYYEGEPKTEASKRTIPMLPEVAQALARENQIAKLLKAPCKDIIPGKKGLVFISTKGTALYASTVNNTIENIVKAYNREAPNKQIPLFSAHQIRHSFCSRLCEQDVNLKLVQTVMGHSNFETTMNIYAEISKEKTQLVFDGLEGRIV